MNEWIVRGICVVAGAAAMKLGEIVVRRIYKKVTLTPLEMRDELVKLVKEQETPPQETPPQETPQEVETTAKA